MKRTELIIDVGMHDGQDTAFYLAKGFDVVAIEANPLLAAQASEAFAPAIERGQLRILPVAIAETEGTLPLAVSDEMSIWSSLSPEFIERNESRAGTEYRYVDVPTRTFESILEEVGVPRYLKIDIEGMDMLCVRALTQFQERPDFVSIESNVSSNTAPFELMFDELAELWGLGYRRFAYVNQLKNPAQRPPNPPREGQYADATFTTDGSGMFGEELPASWEGIERTLRRGRALRMHHNVAGYGGRWDQTVPARAYRLLRRGAGRGPMGWYDLHARLV